MTAAVNTNDPASTLYAGSPMNSGNGNLVMVMAGFILMNEIQNLTGSLSDLFNSIQDNINTIAQNGSNTLNADMQNINNIDSELNSAASDNNSSEVTQYTNELGVAQTQFNNDQSQINQENSQAQVPANSISSVMTTLNSTDMEVTMNNITSASQGVGQQLSQLISSFQV